MDAFIQDLYRMSEYFKYGVLKETLIRDRIVVSVLDERLSDRLQGRKDLTLEKVMEMSQQAEKQVSSLKGCCKGGLSGLCTEGR